LNIVLIGVLIVERGWLVGYGQLDVIVGAVLTDLAICPNHGTAGVWSHTSKSLLRSLEILFCLLST